MTAPDDDERVLVERSRGGDIAAYQELVRRHQDAAVRLAAAVSGGWGDPEAIAQEALVKAHGALGRFRVGAPFRPWLLRIVLNEARNARRAGRRHQRLAQRAAREAPARAPSAEHELLDADERRQVLAAVGRLPRRQREAIACRYLLELSEAETAQALAVAPGTVKSRVSRGLQRLRSDLSRHADHEEVS